MHWSKQRKVVVLIFLMVLLAVLLFAKKEIIFKNQTGENGLVYNGTETLEDLVNTDTDGDTVPDWEEGLYGTDPLKKETASGIPDKSYIDGKRKQTAVDGELTLTSENPENLTQTDKLSRELFGSIAALNQAGEINENTVDTVSNAVLEKIQNPEQRKIFSLSQLKITENNSAQAVAKYSAELDKIYNGSTIKYTVPDVLQKFVIDENTVDETALKDLGPLITQTNKIIEQMIKLETPRRIVELHLNVINGLEKLSENMSDMTLYDSDIITAISGLSQYKSNVDKVQEYATILAQAIYEN